MNNRILFFIADSVPTEQEVAAAKAIGTRCFRNARAVNEGESLEKCEAVAGIVAIPAPYANCKQIEVPEEFKTAPAPEASGLELTEEQKKRNAENEGARGATVAQLKEALTSLGIQFPTNAPKAALLELFFNRP